MNPRLKKPLSNIRETDKILKRGSFFNPADSKNELFSEFCCLFFQIGHFKLTKKSRYVKSSTTFEI